MNLKAAIAFVLLLAVLPLRAQQPVDISSDSTAVIALSPDLDPLRPSKAAFYSAVVPGLGQVYNKRYWKVPLVYAAIGTSLYFYSDNNTKYKQYRDAYKRRLAGYQDDEFQYLDDARLISAQRLFKKNREYSMLFTIGFYLLNIVDANIDAHLKQFNVSEDLTLQPDIYQTDPQSKPHVGLTLNYRF